ncbi:MAG: FkbM family methyltransferase [Bacteroidota bacterium]
MHPRIKHLRSTLTDKEYKKSYQEKKRIKQIPRYEEFSTDLLGTTIRIPDSASFLFMHQEIFINEVYKFLSEKEDPYIIDAGANIGLSVLYFKKLYPASKIIAFEPDKKIFQYLSCNVHEAFQYDEVRLEEKAVWKEETQLSFSSEGADAGRIDLGLEDTLDYTISAVRLRDYLDQTVDFLKIDIEGSETEVLMDCADKLENVERLFVEYHSFSQQEQSLDKLISILSAANFRIFLNANGFGTLHPYIDRKQEYGMDLQLNIFAYRPE